jgi:hypothetical protein
VAEVLENFCGVGEWVFDEFLVGDVDVIEMEEFEEVAEDAIGFGVGGNHCVDDFAVVVDFIVLLLVKNGPLLGLVGNGVGDGLIDVVEAFDVDDLEAGKHFYDSPFPEHEKLVPGGLHEEGLTGLMLVSSDVLNVVGKGVDVSELTDVADDIGVQGFMETAKESGGLQEFGKEVGAAAIGEGQQAKGKVKNGGRLLELDIPCKVRMDVVLVIAFGLVDFFNHGVSESGVGI